MDRLDGYSAPQYPDPGGYGRLECASDGTLWIWSADALKRFDGLHWTSFPVPAVTGFGAIRGASDETWEITSRESAFYRATISVVALNRSRALIMLPDRVLEFDATRSESRPVVTLPQTGLTRFLSMRAARDGTVWLTGRGGLGLLVRQASANDAASGEDWRWRPLPRPPAAWLEFMEPFAGEGGTLLVTGIAASFTKAALLFDGRRWSEVYRGQSPTLRAWPGKDGSIWIQDGNEVMELTAGRKEMADRTGALAGILLSSMPQGPGRFWIAGAQGLALHSPPLWQTPPEAPQIDSVVNAISEDRSGNLWFLSEHALVRFDNSHWSSYPLPKGETSWAIFTEGPAILPDGRLVILTTNAHWLVFDPLRHSFHVLEHPAKRTVRMFIPQPDGTLIAETSPPGSSKDVAFERFDGRTFRPFLGPGKIHAELRNLRLQSSGGIWIGGTSFFSIYRNGEFQPIGASEGFADQGAYYIYEDPSGKMLAGGQDGVYQLDGRRWYRLQSGFDRVRNIIRARDGSLWVSSGTGVHRYRNGIWIANGLEEGLPSSVAYKVFEDSRGRIWAGTTRGLSLFHPEADADPPRALIAEDQNPREAPPGGKIRLVFSGIDRWKFTLPFRLLFSWRMDGAAWSSFAPATSASYDGLSPGEHHFEVRALDRNGNISLTSAAHDFTVLLPWYAMPGFRWLAAGAAVLIVLLLTIAVINYRHRGLLIYRLDQKNKLERDRQSILEMVAKRRPLPQILQMIATCVARNRPGATCVVVRERDFDLEVFSQPLLPEGVSRAIERLRSTRPSPDPGENPFGGPLSTDPPSGEWLRDICPALRAYRPGTCTVVPVSTGDRETLGAIALSSHGDLLSDSDHWLLETFGGMAAAAIENARVYERLAHQARHDVLTGLPNRLCFDARLQSAIAAASATGRPLAVMYLDLDRFKQINDSLGHRSGDLFLQQVAIRLAGALHPGATLARIGGDEFTVLLEHAVDKNFAASVASDMLAALRRPIQISDRELFATASIGISFFPADGETPSALQKHADIAMYRAKARGKNCSEFFAAEMSSTMETAMSMGQILRRALDRGDFELYYQPLFTLDRRLVGFESLLRLNQPGHGLVEPMEFIPVAEETGLIVPIGAWALRQACRQIKEWRDDHLPVARISVNVSALQVARDSFADEVAAALSEMRLPPGCLELELTESAIVANLAESTRQMHKLRSLGVRLAIDDFGTGYSSFAHLETLPLDCLKIDKCFISGFPYSTARASLIHTMAGMGRSLGLTVVAEGVETEEQFALVRQSGCDLVQGHLFSPPLPAAQARAHLLDAESCAVPAR